MAFELEVQERAGVRYWVNPIWKNLGLSHGFFGRDIDVREGNQQWSSWSNTSGLGTEILRIRQVHGTEIVDFEAMDSRLDETFQAEGDSSICSLEQLNAECSLLAVTTADCIPVLLWDPESSLVAAIHCGWRSAVDDLLPKTCQSLFKKGATAATLEATIGPGAGPLYQVGPEVEGAFRESCKRSTALDSPDGLIERSPGDDKVTIDLRGLLCEQLRHQGVPVNNIFCSKICTLSTEEFFSHRREKGLAGRQLSVIGAGSLA